MGKSTATSVRKDADGKLVTTQSAASSKRPAKAAAYECLVNRTTQNTWVYSPFYTSVDNSSVYMQYAHHMTVVYGARRVFDKGNTTQIEMCSTGGAQTFKFWKRLGSTTTSASAIDDRTVIIGQQWGTKARDGQVGSSLGFKLGGGQLPIEVSGSIPVNDGGQWGGAQGRDKNNGVVANVRNQVNADWYTGFWGEGARSFKGNVGHGLWEYPESDTKGHRIAVKSGVTYRY